MPQKQPGAPEERVRKTKTTETTARQTSRGANAGGRHRLHGEHADCAQGNKDKTEDFGKALGLTEREMQTELRELENTASGIPTLGI